MYAKNVLTTIRKVSSVEREEGGSESSPLEADMAEQGRKARASAARLEDAGAELAADNGGGTSDALTGLMPLRCGVRGRQVVIQRGAVLTIQPPTVRVPQRSAASRRRLEKTGQTT